MTTLLAVDAMVKQFGGVHAVHGASFNVEAGSITGLIGPNGAGKTTCFNCVSGFLRADAGRVTFDGHDITGLAPHRVFARGLVRTFQTPQELGALTVLENLMLVGGGQTG
ncbi:MAG: ATP-binding cassette domain-containing protein, partial [Chloroflexi bacterium]|nr:ATP-binding cassette domain-containing protein [Chloroflexota bacterium]